MGKRVPFTFHPFHRASGDDPVVFQPFLLMQQTFPFTTLLFIYSDLKMPLDQINRTEQQNRPLFVFIEGLACVQFSITFFLFLLFMSFVGGFLV